MVRRLVSVVLPGIQSISVSNSAATLTWSAIPGLKYRVQHKQSLDEINWSDLLPDVTADALSASATHSLDSLLQHFFRVQLVP
jgi:hypothetical protein